MAALQVISLLYVCWTPESCTVFRAKFDETLWSTIVSELNIVYGAEKDTASRPKKKRSTVQQLKQMLRKYTEEKVVLLAEFPSVFSKPCNHFDMAADVQDVRGYHGLSNETTIRESSSFKPTSCFISVAKEILMKGETQLNEIYNVLPIPAKEVIVALVSDLDRMKKIEIPHAFPVAYGLSGYSLKVESVRSMVSEIIKVCHEKGITIRCISTDGQFYKLCVPDAAGKPLTIIQVAKDTWEAARKMPKQHQMQQLMSFNRKDDGDELDIEKVNMGNLDDFSRKDSGIQSQIVVKGLKNKKWIRLYNPINLQKMMKCKENKKQSKTKDIDSTSVAQLLLPEGINEVADELSEVRLDNDVRNTMNDIPEDINLRLVMQENETYNVLMDTETPEEDNVSCNDDEPEKAMDISDEHTSNMLRNLQPFTFSAMVHDLKLGDKKRKNQKWSTLNETKLEQILSSEPETVNKYFTKVELVLCATHLNDIFDKFAGSSIQSLTKLELVNLFSEILGNKVKLATKKSPKSLRNIVKEFVNKKFGKDILNAIFATYNFLENDLPKWRAQALFKDGVFVGKDENPYVWYCQPELYSSVGEYIEFLLDCHHLFVNARCFICKNGISGLGIKKEGWIAVAETNKEANVGLNLAMVKDVIDRQSNAMAKVMFSEKVENRLQELGLIQEAIFCSVFRNWYKAEDEPGLSAVERHKARMDLRHLLLDSVKLAQFPPPGSYVAGMPIIMFEGLLTNIDRRIQLHTLVPGRSYNVRAPNSLDAENFFSEFQDLDPKSSGALLADDIPSAIETASYLMQMRLDPDR